MQEMRDALEAGTFEEWKAQFAADRARGIEYALRFKFASRRSLV